jgi:hypothetical protein
MAGISRNAPPITRPQPRGQPCHFGHPAVGRSSGCAGASSLGEGDRAALARSVRKSCREISYIPQLAQPQYQVSRELDARMTLPAAAVECWSWLNRCADDCAIWMKRITLWGCSCAALLLGTLAHLRNTIHTHYSTAPDTLRRAHGRHQVLYCTVHTSLGVGSSIQVGKTLCKSAWRLMAEFISHSDLTFLLT